MTRINSLRFLRGLIPGLLSFICVLTFAACSGSTPTGNQASPGNPSATPPILRVATSPAFPPFESKAADGTLIGFDIDLINAIGGTAGFIIDFDELSFDDIIRELYAGNVDVAISAITITPERADKVAFSRPYFKAGLAIAVPAANTDITSLETLKGKRIGVERGTTGETKAQQIPEAKVQAFNSAPEAFQQLISGQLDAVINDAPVTTYAIASGTTSGLKVVGQPLTEEFYGIATPRNSPHLEKINSAFTTVLGNGTYSQIYKKWFAGEPPQLPEAPTS